MQILVPGCAIATIVSVSTIFLSCQNTPLVTTRFSNNPSKIQSSSFTSRKPVDGSRRVDVAMPLELAFHSE